MWIQLSRRSSQSGSLSAQSCCVARRKGLIQACEATHTALAKIVDLRADFVGLLAVRSQMLQNSRQHDINLLVLRSAAKVFLWSVECPRRQNHASMFSS